MDDEQQGPGARQATMATQPACSLQYEYKVTFLQLVWITVFLVVMTVLLTLACVAIVSWAKARAAGRIKPPPPSEQERLSAPGQPEEPRGGGGEDARTRQGPTTTAPPPPTPPPGRPAARDIRVPVVAESTIIYVTPQGECYHKNKNCTARGIALR